MTVIAAGCGRGRDHAGETGETEEEIVGGVLTPLQSMVRLSMFNQIDAALAAPGARNPSWFCSGRRIARGVILTAAHCVHGATMADISFPNIAAGGGQRTFEGVMKGAIADGYTGAHMDARDIAVLLYNETPALPLGNIPLQQPRWDAAGGRGRTYGRRTPTGADGAANAFYRSPTAFYSHSQMPLTIIASTTNPAPAVPGSPVEAPFLHSGDSGGPFAVRRSQLRTIAVNSAGDSECRDDGMPVPGRGRVVRNRVKQLRRTYAPAPAAWVDTPVGRSYWAGFDNTALTWLGTFVTAAATNNGVWPALYNLAPVTAPWFSIENANHCVSRHNGFAGQQDCHARPAAYDNRYPMCIDAGNNKVNFNLNNAPPIAADILREFIPTTADACYRNADSCTPGIEARDTSCMAWCRAVAARSNSAVLQAGCGPAMALRTCGAGAGPSDYIAECKCQLIALGPPPPGGGVITATGKSMGMGSGSGKMDGGVFPDAFFPDAFFPDAMLDGGGSGSGPGSGVPDAGIDGGMPDGGGSGSDAGVPDAGMPDGGGSGSDGGMPDGGPGDGPGSGDGPPPSPFYFNGWPSWATNLPLTPGCYYPDSFNDCWLRVNNVGSIEFDIEPIFPPPSGSADYGSADPDEEPGIDDGD